MIKFTVTLICGSVYMYLCVNVAISMVRLTVDSELTSADVSVTSTNPTCAGMYVVMATPVNGGDAVTTMSTSSPVEVTGLNFCASNYTFTVMVQYRAGGNGPSVTDNNVQGERMGKLNGSDKKVTHH